MVDKHLINNIRLALNSNKGLKLKKSMDNKEEKFPIL
jgi:hypothetical protein